MEHVVKKEKKRNLRIEVKKYRYMYLLLAPAVLLVFVFRYIPAWGSIMAFYDYKPALGFSGSQFVGLKHFIRFFKDSNFWLLIRNTLVISLLRTILLTVFPIIFAILLNELRGATFKKVVQTISYLPYFVSFVVVANISLTMFGTDGPINMLLMKFGIIDSPVVFFTIPEAFWGLISGVQLWQGLGWSSIIYLSAIAGIDPVLYEAAKVDGAGRFRRMWHITFKSIRPTVIVTLIMEVPNLLKAGFDASYLLGNAQVQDYSEVLDTYVYRIGMTGGQFSYSTAIGLFTAIISMILIFSANAVARRYSEYSMF